MRRRLLATLLVGAVIVGTIPAPVAAAEDPRFVTTVSEPRLTPGAEQVLAIQLENDADEVGDRVKTARNVRVEAQAGDTPFEIVSGTQTVGTMPDGVPTPVSIRLAVPADAPAGDYRIPLSVTYEYDADERETTTVFATVTVPDHPIFEVTDVSSTVSVGERGSVAVTLRNNGSARARDASLDVQTRSAALSVEGAASGARYVGDWGVNESRTVTFDATAAPTATTQSYPVAITPSYEDENGITKSVAPLTIGVEPAPEQSFAIESVQVTAFSGTTATVEATLSNTGDRPVRNAVATLSTSDPAIRVTDATAAVGTLDAGASTPVTFELRMPPGAVSGPRQFSTVVAYERDDGRTYRSDPVSFQASLSTGTAVLELRPVNNTFGIDTSNRLVVTVTNTGEQTLEDVHARLLVQPPYASDTPTSYVSSLEPGESATLTFEVTTPGDAVGTTDALPVVLNATTADDRSVTTGPTLVPVVIAASESPTGNTTNLLIGVVVVAVALGAVWWWLNR